MNNIKQTLAGIFNLIFLISLSIIVYQATGVWWSIPIAVVAGLLIGMLPFFEIFLMPIGTLLFVSALLFALGVYNNIPFVGSLIHGVNAWFVVSALGSYLLYIIMNRTGNVTRGYVFFALAFFFVLRTVNIICLAIANENYWMIAGGLLFAAGGFLFGMGITGIVNNFIIEDRHEVNNALAIVMILLSIVSFWLFTYTTQDSLWKYLSFEYFWISDQVTEGIVQSSEKAQKLLAMPYPGSNHIKKGIANDVLPYLFVFMLFAEWIRRMRASYKSGAKRSLIYSVVVGAISFVLLSYFILQYFDKI